MLPRSGRVGTTCIYTSAAEVRDRSRAAHGAFYAQRYRSPHSPVSTQSTPRDVVMT